MRQKTSVRRLLVLVSVLALFAVIPAVATAGTPGNSVEGPGVYDDNVWITTTGDAQYIEEGSLSGFTPPVVYGAPNASLPADFTKNGCIDDYDPGEGFADVDKKHEYTFQFKETVNDFSLRMLDFGDYNPTKATNHEVVMTAYDADDNPVATDTLSFTSDGAVNPRSGSAGDLWSTGDGCTATQGQPGNYVFNVTGDGIAYVTLSATQGLDPNIGFTELDYSLDGFCVFGEVWDDYEVTLWAGQTIDAGTVNVSYDGTNIYVEFQTTGNWLMTETHVAVVDDFKDFPTTNKGNPIPGQFPYSMPHDPWTDNYTEVIPWDDGVPVYVAAHAALVEADFGGPFWADEVVDYSLGYRTAVDNPFRVLPESALDEPNNVFYSLGLTGNFVPSGNVPPIIVDPDDPQAFVGNITVAFDGWVVNGDGYDISVHEITGSRPSYPVETADVFGWYDGDWEFLGSVSNKDNGSGIALIDLDDAGLPYVEKVKIVDTTPVGNYLSQGVPNYDGYDLDAVDAQVLYYGEEETGWGEGERFVDKGNWGMYFMYDPGSECVWPTD